MIKVIAPAEAKQKLINDIHCERQSQAILDLKLQRLTKIKSLMIKVFLWEKLRNS